MVGGSGVMNAAINKTKVTPVIMGAYIFLLILAILDTFGGQLSVLSGALAMLAVVYVLIGVDPTTKKTIFPWDTILGVVKQAPVPTSTGQEPTESRGPGQT